MAQTVKGQSWLAHFWKSALRAKTYNLDSTTHADNPEGLVRRLGPFDLVLLGIGASVGAGIFVVTGTVAREAGPGVTISFILAGAACVLNALCYAELSSRFPAVVGGAYLYAYSAFNELTAFLVFVQLMLDYHIGAASIARSLASYLVTILQLFPFLKENLPQWLGPGGMECFGGYLSINLLAPVLLALLTLILCQGVRESSAVNAIMTILKVTIVLLVIFAGAFEVDVSNWTPFAPNGFKAIVTGATVVFFAYVGFDAIANSAEECRKPKRDMPIGILVSLIACAALYIGVCLVLTGMLPYQSLGGDAPLAEAFSAKGLKFAVVLISVGAVAGLTTTLLVGLYVQSRLYFGLGRDGLLPSFFGKIHSKLRTPIHSQVWVGSVAGILAGLFNDSALSHILSVGTLSGYSVVSACVIMLRIKNDMQIQSGVHSKGFTKWHQAVVCILGITCCGFASGLCYRIGTYFINPVILMIVAIFLAAVLQYGQEYIEPPGFSCPGAPLIPALSVFVNIFLFAQLHWEAWVRFIVLGIGAVIIYALYGQYHADPDLSTLQDTVLYQRAATSDDEPHILNA
uniref:TSA: Wollemia nobilis Ref_Wollemi_Transcript_7899_1996 transcribed RNA sequence n=1 Tax=Wollemia nobilis TaxID=56998 RepID=A0A0C9S7P7_9CONI